MELELLRYSDKNESTTGLLSADLGCCKDFLCFTLEDTYRNKKIKGETRIPSGRYKIELRTIGGHHKRYKKKFPEFHKGMLELKDVEGFTDILIHIGNTIKDTKGCILTGWDPIANIIREGWSGASTSAYKYVYQYIIKAFNDNEEVWINIIDYYLKG